MEPIPETTEAVEEYGPFEADLIEHLRERATQVQELVPDCVGLSIASNEHGVTFTVVATDEEIAALDGIQYIEGGPCVESVRAERVLEFKDDELFGESSWQLFGQATSAAGVKSTLTLPIIVGDRVMGSVNLYAATPTAFAGNHEPIAQIFHAWAPGAVANADLSFSTRGIAERAPQLLQEDMHIQVALGTLMTTQEIDLDAAREMLSDAARRGGTSEAALAETLIAGVAHDLGD